MADAKTCRDLALWSRHAPTYTTDVQITEQEPTTTCQLQELTSLRTIPRQRLYEQLKDQILAIEEARPHAKCWCIVDGIGFSRNAFIYFNQIVNTVDHVHNYQRLNRWIKEDVAAFKKQFADWFQFEWGRWSHKHMLRTEGMCLSVQVIPYFADDEWLNETILDQTLYCFRSLYGKQGNKRSLFIPIDAVESWITLYNNPTMKMTADGYTWQGRDTHSDGSYDINSVGVQQGEYDKAYAIIYIGQHWGVIAIDFRTRSLAFGDSMHRTQKPHSHVRAIQHWLRENLPEKECKLWNFKATIDTLFTARQSDGGSCGAHALEAIEFDVNRTCDCSNDKIRRESCTSWAPRPALALRVRYLQQLSGYSLVSFPFFLPSLVPKSHFK